MSSESGSSLQGAGGKHHGDMDAAQKVTPLQLKEFLLQVATVRPVFIWGAPGIGKTSIVNDFANELGYDCVSLLGTQLAPEDLIGVPQIVETEHGGRSRFCPPTMIARDEPYVLFLDELNGASVDVQKAAYSLILDHKLGEMTLPEGSVVIAAGNRVQDQAIVKPMASALVNRLVHVSLEVSVDEWVGWAYAAGLHSWVIDYVKTRPDHLASRTVSSEAPFSTPRSWHMLSDVLNNWGTDIDPKSLKAVASGCLSPATAGQFCAWVAGVRGKWDLSDILKGEKTWPSKIEERELLYMLAQSLKAKLAKELPTDKSEASGSSKQLAHRAKGAMLSLADISVECAQSVISDGDLPPWFLTEVVRELPRLAGSS